MQQKKPSKSHPKSKSRIVPPLKRGQNIIIPTIRAEHIAHKMEFGKRSNWKVVYPLGNKEGQRFFPGDEVYVRLPEEVLRSRGRIVILHSGAPDPNGGLAELEMILNVLRRANLSVEIFFANFPYARQDHAFHLGETNAVKDLLDKLVHHYNVKHIYVLDAHFAGHNWVSNYPLTLVSALSLLKKAAEKDFPGVEYMAPDAGGQRRANLKGTTKERTDSFNTTIHTDQNFAVSVKGKIVGAVDDLVSTGGTLAGFATACRESGAKGVIALLTHGVLVEGIKRLISVFSKLYLTNSIARDDANVDVSGLILQTIKSRK
jgi:ribose-phosphate pyrophosphokinase